MANIEVDYAPAPTWLVQGSVSATRGFDVASAFINMNQLSFAQALAATNLTGALPTQAQRPFPNINNAVLDVRSIGNSRYNAANFKLEKRYSYGLTLLLNYTVSKDIETKGTGPSSYSQIGNSQALDSTNLIRDESVAPMDLPQVFSFSCGYALPWGPRKHWLNSSGGKGMAGRILGVG